MTVLDQFRLDGKCILVTGGSRGFGRAIALAAAEAWAGPWASFCPFPLPLSSRDTPPYGPGLPPASGPAGRLRDRLTRPLLDDTLGRAIRTGQTVLTGRASGLVFGGLNAVKRPLLPGAGA